MTSFDEALRALEKKWRDESNRRQESAGEMENDEPQDVAWNSGIAAGLDECADELAALLSDRQEVAPVGYMDPEADFMLPRKGGCVLSSHVVLVRDPSGKYTRPVYLSTGQTSDARDAARYRWLAENAIIQWPGVTHIGDDPASTRLPLDNAIDAAMRQEAGSRE